MKIVPCYTTTKNYSLVPNCSTINANDVLIDSDGNLSNDYFYTSFTHIYDKEGEEIKSIYLIKAITIDFRPVVLIKNNEENNRIYFCKKISDDKWQVFFDLDYDGGDIVYDVSYIQDKIIVAFSEYFDNNENSKPLRILEFDKDFNILNPNTLEICPKVHIPSVEALSSVGTLESGWYFIFIRYRINNYDYTNWFYTGKSIMLYDVIKEEILNYKLTENRYISINDETFLDITGKEGFPTEFIRTASINVENIYHSKAFKLFFGKLSDNYNKYQVGIIFKNKTNSLAYRSEDIDIVQLSYKVDKHSLINYSIEEIFNKTVNYFNVKELKFYDNRLYIANYKEKLLPSNYNDYIDISYVTATNEDDFYTNYTSNNVSEIHSSWTFTLNNKNIIVTNINKMQVDNNIFYGASLNDILDTDGYFDIYDKTNKKYENCILEDVYILDDYSLFLKNNNLKIDDWDHCVIDKVYYYKDSITITPNTFINKENNTKFNSYVCPSIYEDYEIYIHYVDEYGNYTDGIKCNSLWKGYSNAKLYAKVKKIPNGYIGYFFSFKKTLNSIEDIGFGTTNYGSEDNTISGDTRILTNKLYTSEPIRMDFDYINPISFFNDEDEPSEEDREIRDNNIANLDLTILGTISVKSDKENIPTKNLEGIDQFNQFIPNINSGKDFRTGLMLLRRSTIVDNVKELVVASKIYYDIDIPAYLDFNECFISDFEIIVWNKDTYYDETTNLYKRRKNRKIFSQHDYNKRNFALNPFNVYKVEDFKYHTPIIYELINKPKNIFIPKYYWENDKVITKDEFEILKIFDVSNFNNLFKSNHFSYREAFPIYLQEKSDIYNNIFTHTIRRSNVIKTESTVNSYRLFSTEDYVVVDTVYPIIKLIPLGSNLLIHTEVDVLILDNTSSLNSEGNILQLKKSDIFNINSKRLITSINKEYGLTHKDEGIYGSFGYIFYSKEGKTIYRYDNNKLENIGDIIKKYLISVSDRNLKLILMDDILNNRIFIRSDLGDLSYNYKLNCFVSKTSAKGTECAYEGTNLLVFEKYPNSFHTSRYLFGNNTYMSENYIGSKIEILINENIDRIKFLEQISIDISILDNSYFSRKYSPKMIRIVSDSCDSGWIDTKVSDENEMNKISDYKKPYYRLGVWNFNNFYDKHNYNWKDPDYSRIYGKWFIICIDLSTLKTDLNINDVHINIAHINYKVEYDIK